MTTRTPSVKDQDRTHIVTRIQCNRDRKTTLFGQEEKDLLARATKIIERGQVWISETGAKIKVLVFWCWIADEELAG